MKKSLFALALAACFAFGTPDLATAEKECDGGNMKSCTQAGALHIIKNDNPDKGVKMLKETCDKGDTYSCWFLGSQYIGKGFLEKDKDIEKAKIYFEKACDGGYYMGCMSLAVDIYGTDDMEKAAIYYRKSCDLGNSLGSENAFGSFDSCYRFAIYSQLAMNDTKKAAQYYKKACDLGKDDPSAGLFNTWQKSCDMYELLK